MRKKRISHPIRVIILFVCILPVGGLIFRGCFQWGDPCAFFDKDAARKVIAAIQSDTLPVNSDGAVRLPPFMASKLPSDRVYVTRTSQGTHRIYFPIPEMKLWLPSDRLGMLYCDRALASSDRKQGKYEKPDRPRYEARTGYNDKVPVEILEDQGNGWYKTVIPFNIEIGTYGP